MKKILFTFLFLTYLVSGCVSISKYKRDCDLSFVAGQYSGYLVIEKMLSKFNDNDPITKWEINSLIGGRKTLIKNSLLLDGVNIDEYLGNIKKR